MVANRIPCEYLETPRRFSYNAFQVERNSSHQFKFLKTPSRIPKNLKLYSSPLWSSLENGSRILKHSVNPVVVPKIPPNSKLISWNIVYTLRNMQFPSRILQESQKNPSIVSKCTTYHHHISIPLNELSAIVAFYPDRYFSLSLFQHLLGLNKDLPGEAGRDKTSDLIRTAGVRFKSRTSGTWCWAKRTQIFEASGAITI